MLTPLAFLYYYCGRSCAAVFNNGLTVNSAYNGSAYKELSVIRNSFSFPDLDPSLFYVKIYG